MWWWRLRAEVGRWERAGHAPRLWLRDDDAEAPGPALDTLLGLAASHRVPVTLAVVPRGGALPALAERLARAPATEVIQHGTDHLDRRAGPAAEFADAAAPEAVLRAVVAAQGRLRAAFPAALPAYAPPWNALQPVLSTALAGAGFAAVSGYGTGARSWNGLQRLDTHADLLRWNPHPRARGEWAFVARLLRQLAERRRTADWASPVGVLSHHLAHDAAGWRRLDTLLRMTPRVAWHPMSGLLAAG